MQSFPFVSQPLFFATLVSSLTPMEAKLLVSDGEIGQDEANAAKRARLPPSDVANVVTT